MEKETRRQKLIFVKREEEQKLLNQRLEAARRNSSEAQTNLQRVLDEKHLKSEQLLEQSSSSKVYNQKKFDAYS